MLHIKYSFKQHKQSLNLILSNDLGECQQDIQESHCLVSQDIQECSLQF